MATPLAQSDGARGVAMPYHGFIKTTLEPGAGKW